MSDKISFMEFIRLTRELKRLIDADFITKDTATATMQRVALNNNLMPIYLW